MGENIGVWLTSQYHSIHHANSGWGMTGVHNHRYKYPKMAIVSTLGSDLVERMPGIIRISHRR